MLTDPFDVQSPEVQSRTGDAKWLRERLLDLQDMATQDSEEYARSLKQSDFAEEREMYKALLGLAEHYKKFIDLALAGTTRLEHVTEEKRKILKDIEDSKAGRVA